MLTYHSIDKFYSLTEPLLRSFLSDDSGSEFPFELSQEELHIVLHFRTSTLILGRSGTGKTTCLIFKILIRSRAKRLISGEDNVRQACLLPLANLYFTDQTSSSL